MPVPVLCTGATAGTSLHFAGSGKEERKLPLLANNLVLYVENPKESTKKTIIIHEFSQVAIYKNQLLLYTVLVSIHNEMKKTISFTIVSKRINLTKEVQNVYSGKLQTTLLKEIQEDLNKWKDIPQSWTERFNIVKIIILPGFPGGAVVKNPPANAGDTGSSPGLGRSHMPRSN